MPNTLAHIAVQTAINAPWQPGRYIPWVLLGCVIPDVPWIVRRVVLFAIPGVVDELTLEIYASVQASLFLSVLLAAAAAAFVRRPLAVWLVLAANCAAHLLLDAVEIKPGSGVHLLAPFSWRTFSLGVVWPEHAVITGLSAVGVGVAALVLLAPRFRRLREPLVLDRKRAAVACAALIGYLLLPLPLSQGLWEADYRSMRSLTDSAMWIGHPVELDRDVATRIDGEPAVRVFGRDYRLITDTPPPPGAVISLTGRIASAETIEVAELHLNAPGFRDGASMVGLALIAALWLRLLSYRSLN